MIGEYNGNEVLALDCVACPKPILPGQVYVLVNAGRHVHHSCMLAPPVPVAAGTDGHAA